MLYIFMDESGQFNKKSRENYFIIASFVVDNPQETEKSFRSWCQTRFPKRMRDQGEIKWSATGIDDALRLRTLKHIAKMNISIRYGYFFKENIPHRYWSRNGLESGLLFQEVVKDLLVSYMPFPDDEIFIFCDQRSLKQVTKQKFESFIEESLKFLAKEEVMVTVKMIDSTANTNIHIADWIVGGLARWIEQMPAGDRYFEALQGKIAGGREFFNFL